MFCNQCQETLRNKGCTERGVCGKTNDVADLQDLLIHMQRGISYYQVRLREVGKADEDADIKLMEYLFSTITNTNFDKEKMLEFIRGSIAIRDRLKALCIESGIELGSDTPDHALWDFKEEREALDKAEKVGHLSIEDEDRRGLYLLVLYSIKGITAYLHHAYALGFKDESISDFMNRALLATWDPSTSMDDMLGWVMRTGEYGVITMELLDRANTTTYGVPTPTKVKLGVRDRPGILISGHDLKDLHELLEQTKGTGVDVYTHGEMLPANYYPFFKKYDNFIGNYGSSWWKQILDFDTFNGPVILTSNCLVPPLDKYKERVYTTGVVGFEGVKYIPDRTNGGSKDFSAVIEHALKCPPPRQLEDIEIVGGFNHATLWGLKDTVLDAVRSGKIKKFIVMAGCDGRHKTREYYTEFAKALPKEAVILTAGCAKYRYNKDVLDDIDGIPRVIDAGQCNDSYSLALFALKLAEHLKVNVNDLPLAFNIAWYEQKAELILLALLHLGFKNMTIGPTLPAFVTPNILKVLVDKFGLGLNSSVEEDMQRMLV
ncbi:MAG: hydroxylamine reductase [Candidatus Thermoplasmatota archaeon]|nr:hydroxylamine reductase [Candidatus Thermoplasmatota archaeon]